MLGAACVDIVTLIPFQLFSDACTATWLGIAVCGSCRLLACIGGLATIVRVCLWWFPALLPACLCIRNHRVSL